MARKMNGSDEPSAAVAMAIRSRKGEVSSDKLEQLKIMVREARNLDVRIGNGEELLKTLKTEQARYLTNVIPDMMASLRVPSITIEAEGNMPAYTASNKPFYSAGISSRWDEEKRQDALQYLKDIGHGDLIKQEVSFLFPVGTDLRMIHEFVNKVVKLRIVDKRRRKLEIPIPTVSEGVHAGTLTSWLKRLVESKDALASKLKLDKIGGYVGQKVELKTVKDK